MPLSRYSFSNRIKNNRYYGTSNVNHLICSAIKQNRISYQVLTLAEGTRLDHLAYAYYKDSSLWWIIAAASGIGYGLQLPPGRLIYIPSNLNEVYDLL